MRAVNRLARRLAALLLAAPFLTFASALAPEHVHEPGSGHDHAVAHSHFGPHLPSTHESAGTEIEHDDHDHGDVVWLDSPILHEAPYRAASALPAIPVSYDALLRQLHWSATAVDEIAPAHGPPKRAHLFRGPPSLV
jgi:hypothetical protein